MVRRRSLFSEDKGQNYFSLMFDAFVIRVLIWSPEARARKPSELLLNPMIFTSNFSLRWSPFRFLNPLNIVAWMNQMVNLDNRDYDLIP